jgi:hypothetical protein
MPSLAFVGVPQLSPDDCCAVYLGAVDRFRRRSIRRYLVGGVGGEELVGVGCTSIFLWSTTGRYPGRGSGTGSGVGKLR